MCCRVVHYYNSYHTSLIMANESSEDASLVDIEETQYWENNQPLQEDSIVNDDPAGYVLPPGVPEAVRHVLGHPDWSIEDIIRFFTPYDGTENEINYRPFNPQFEDTIFVIDIDFIQDQDHQWLLEMLHHFPIHLEYYYKDLIIIIFYSYLYDRLDYLLFQIFSPRARRRLCLENLIL